MSKKEMVKYLLEANSSVSAYQVIVAMCVAFVLGMFMYWVYRKTYVGIAYSKNFNGTLVLVAVITTMVMMIIGSNLALSLGMVGSLSIIRFRSAVKEPKDMAYLFWAIAIGLSCGAEMYMIAFIGSIVVTIVLFILKGDIYDQNSFMLVIKGNGYETAEIENKLSENTKKWKVRMSNVSDIQQDITYEINVKGKTVIDVVKQIKNVSGVESVNVVTYTGEIVG